MASEFCEHHQSEKCTHVYNGVPLCKCCISSAQPPIQSELLLPLSDLAHKEVDCLDSLSLQCDELSKKLTDPLFSKILATFGAMEIDKDSAVRDVLIRQITDFLKEDSKKIKASLLNIAPKLAHLSATLKELLATARQECAQEKLRALWAKRESTEALKKELEELVSSAEFVAQLSSGKIPSVKLLGVGLADVNELYSSIVGGYVASLAGEEPKAEQKRPEVAEAELSHFKKKKLDNTDEYWNPCLSVCAYEETEDDFEKVKDKIRKLGNGQSDNKAQLLNENTEEPAPQEVPIAEMKMPMETIERTLSFAGTKSRDTIFKDLETASTITKLLAKPDPWEDRARTIIAFLETRKELYKLEVSNITAENDNDLVMARVIQAIQTIPKVHLKKIACAKDRLRKLLFGLLNVKIEKLYLEGLEISTEPEVIAVLRQCKSLSLNNCALDLLHKGDLGAVLSGTKTIQKLKVKKCRLTDEDIENLKAGLKKNKSVVKLDLSHNAITLEGFTKILECCKKNITLKELEMRGNKVDYSNIGPNIVKILEKRTVPLEAFVNGSK
eukprot:TRINITY_DN11158_c0_g1_i23.p1 TRINITY_DN11158_c0_g1~~TRINITY_DN11158_c0_g1_i23.p1  ORF type:complete len:556 (+),score=193.35 TRINITY_DN11158_c0_g1_i23:198-1865(+)